MRQLVIILIIFTFIGDPKPIDEQDMGDPNKKELSDEEMDSFDEKRGEAMGAYSEVSVEIQPRFLCLTFPHRESGRKLSDCSRRPSR